LVFAVDESIGGVNHSNTAPSSDSPSESIFAAVQEQLGLKLESKKSQVEILVIDHVEQPSED